MRATQRFLVISILLGSAIISFPSRGQAPDNDTDEMGLLEEVIVTARRREETLLEVPESINVFSSQLIKDAEIQAVDDFSRLTPGVVVQQGFQGGDRPIIIFRGVGQIGGSSPSVVILTDGIYAPVGDPLRNQMYDIERIEVVKGPQGALYGRDSIGGLINIITKSPGNDFSGEIQASYEGKPDERRFAGMINIPMVEDTFMLRLAGSSVEADGFFTNLSGEDHDFRKESFIRARALWKTTEDLTFDFRLSHNKFNNGYNGAFYSHDADTYIGDFDDVLTAIDYPDGFNKRDVTDGAVKFDWSLDNMMLTSITQYVDSEQNLVQDADFQLAPPLSIVRDSLTKDKSWSQELRLASTDDRNLNWLIGVFYEDSKYAFEYSDEELLFLGPLGGSSSKTDTTRYALFGQLDWDISEKWVASLALRYDKTKKDLTAISPVSAVNSLDTDRTSPKASLSYYMTPDTSFYATYGEGFRSGGFDPTTNITFQDEDLKSLEFGLKSSLVDNRLFLTAAAYQIKYTDQQIAVLTTDPNTGGLIVTTENLAESRMNGFEVGLYYTQGGLDLSVGLDVLDSEIKDDPDETVIGNDTPFSTDYTLSLTGQYTWSLSGSMDLKTRLEYYYQGNQTWDKGNTMIQDSYGLLSARIALEAEHWQIALSGQNILDEDYNDQLFANFGIPGLNAVYPGLPARWRISASWRF